MKLSLYLPNFRDKVTVGEIVGLTQLAEELDFDSIWTLDRIVVPETSDTQQMQKGFGGVPGQPRTLPVSARGQFLHGLPLVPYLAALTKKIRLGTSIMVTAYRAPGVLAAEMATVDNLSGGRLNVGVGAGWMPEEFEVANASHIYDKKGKHLLETIEVMQGVWTQDIFEYHGEFASFERCGFGIKPIQKPHPPIYFGGMLKPNVAAKRISKYGLAGWIGSHHMPEEIAVWRDAIAAEFANLDTDRTIDNLDLCCMTPFEITKERTDLSMPLIGTEQQVADSLKRFKEAGLTMPLLWPPFSGTSTSKTMDDLNRLKNDIMPKIEDL